MQEKQNKHAKKREPEKKNGASINTILCLLIPAVMVVMFLNYALLTLSEYKLSKISTDTMILNNDNVELQNKLDNLMSYHNVEQTVKEEGLLETAQNVIELKESPSTDEHRIHRHKTTKRIYYRFPLGF